MVHFLFFWILSSIFSATIAYGGVKAADLVVDNQPIDIRSEKYKELFKELEEQYNFNKQDLDTIFQDLTISKKVLELMDKQWETLPYYQYASLFITPESIRVGKQKLEQYKELLRLIEDKIGVEKEIVVAIWGIESRYGTKEGAFNVLRTLNTLFDAYPRRSSFFRKQLIHFLLLCKENDIDPKTVMGSYAGAFGQTQFIPSSFRAYAISFDNDSKRDVWNSVPDILASIANYLKQFHWTIKSPIYAELGNELKDKRLKEAYLAGRNKKISWEVINKVQKTIPMPAQNEKLAIIGLELPPGSANDMRYIAAYSNFIAITKWNNSDRYAMAVVELAESLKKSDK